MTKELSGLPSGPSAGSNPALLPAKPTSPTKTHPTSSRSHVSTSCPALFEQMNQGEHHIRPETGTWWLTHKDPAWRLRVVLYEVAPSYSLYLNQESAHPQHSHREGASSSWNWRARSREWNIRGMFPTWKLLAQSWTRWLTYTSVLIWHCKLREKFTPLYYITVRNSVWCSMMWWHHGDNQ